MKALPLLASITAISLLTSNADGQQVREFTVYEAPFDGGPVSHRWGGGCIRNCFRYGGLKSISMRDGFAWSLEPPRTGKAACSHSVCFLDSRRSLSVNVSTRIRSRGGTVVSFPTCSIATGGRFGTFDMLGEWPVGKRVSLGRSPTISVAPL